MVQYAYIPREGVVSAPGPTGAWQVNILTTGSICEIQICPAGTIVWLALINETHVQHNVPYDESLFFYVGT